MVQKGLFILQFFPFLKQMHGNFGKIRNDEMEGRLEDGWIPKGFEGREERKQGQKKGQKQAFKLLLLLFGMAMQIRKDSPSLDRSFLLSQHLYHLPLENKKIVFPSSPSRPFPLLEVPVHLFSRKRKDGSLDNLHLPSGKGSKKKVVPPHIPLFFPLQPCGTEPSSSSSSWG